jgi:uncharacterized protein DUF2752
MLRAMAVAAIARSDRAVPHLLARLAGVALVCALVGAVHLRHRPATLCLLRGVTGIPCPFCGGTTAAADLGRADLRGALAASPLAVLVAAGLPFAGLVHAPRWWADRHLRTTVVLVVLMAAEVFQLVRFGLVPT